ncbi:unnamed protein product [Polarella glacialis]|uniref:Uncharacterized protein n=1 Tax=Polarella glacialis TaxID=89957 RepID=A0A813EE83_POLGL|nr:unnamed protein product [Polarella glacialis]
MEQSLSFPFSGDAKELALCGDGSPITPLEYKQTLFTVVCLFSDDDLFVDVWGECLQDLGLLPGQRRPRPRACGYPYLLLFLCSSLFSVYCHVEETPFWDCL